MDNIKTDRSKFFNEKTLIVAIDVSKYHLTVYVRCPDDKERRSSRVSNDYKGLMELWKIIEFYVMKYKLMEVIVGFESTGVYSEPLINFMKDKPVKMVQVNPMHTKRVKEVSDNSPNKTDEKDPRVIADIIQLGHTLSVIVPQGASAELRNFTHSREAQIIEKNRNLNRLESLEFKIFPEFVQQIKDLDSRTAKYLLEKYPTPEDIKRVQLEELSDEIRKISRGRHKKEFAQRLKELAENSLGTKEGQESVLIEIKHILARLKEIEKFIKEIEKRMAMQLELVPYSRNLLSIKGIKVVTLAGIIGEVVDFRNYRVQSEVTKLAGLNLYEISSGKERGMRRITKRGRWLLRKLLFFASLNVVRCCGKLRSYYQRLIGRGIKKIKALTAVARKLLRIMFAMVRDGTSYVDNYESKKLEEVEMRA